MNTNSKIKLLRKQNDRIIRKAQRVIINKIRNTLSQKPFYGRITEFKARKTIRLDKYDLDLDEMITEYFTPESLTIENDEVCLTYCENEYDPLDKGDYTYSDRLEDLTLSDCQNLLFVLEEEMFVRISKKK